MKALLRLNTIKRQMLFITGVLVVLLLIFELLFAGYLFSYSAKVSRTNVDYVFTQITSRIKNTFNQMNDVIDSITSNPTVQDYVVTENVGEQYKKAFEHALPIVKTATMNLNYEHVLISNYNNSWYRCIGYLSQTACRELTGRFGGTLENINTIIDLDGVYYLCTIKPIVSVKNYTLIHNGMVAALFRIENVFPLIGDLGEPGNIIAYINNEDTSLQYSGGNLVSITQDEFDKRIDAEYSLSRTIMDDTVTITVSIPGNQVFPQSSAFLFAISFVLIFSMSVILLGSLSMQKWIVTPISQVIDDVSGMGVNYYNKKINQTGVMHIDILVTSVNAMLERLSDYSHRAFKSQQALYEAELNKQQAQLHMLRKQIDAHFIYNTLGSIKALANMGNTENIAEISQGLASILRFINSGKDEVNFFDEFEIIQQYINILNIRFGNKFKTHFDVDDRLCEYRIIKQLLQPLVENAVFHGLEPLNAAGNIYIRGYLEEGAICIIVKDDGIGIPEEQLIGIQENLKNIKLDRFEPAPHLQGMALLNIQKRIWIAYGVEYGLMLNSVQNGFTEVILHLPQVLDASED